MGRFVVRRLLASVPVLFLVSLITFGLLWLVPGDPAAVFLDASATAEDLNRVRHELGLDRPFLLRMGDWYLRLFQGDLGTSLLLNRSVTSAIFERLPVTLSLTALASRPASLCSNSRGRKLCKRLNRSMRASCASFRMVRKRAMSSPSAHCWPTCWPTVRLRRGKRVEESHRP